MPSSLCTVLGAAPRGAVAPRGARGAASGADCEWGAAPRAGGTRWRAALLGLGQAEGYLPCRCRGWWGVFPRSVFPFGSCSLSFSIVSVHGTSVPLHPIGFMGFRLRR